MFKKILVPVDIDYPETAAAVYQRAKTIAGLSDAEIRIISVLPGFGMPIVASLVPDDVRQETRDRFQDAMEKFIKEYCGEDVSYTIRTGKNWEEIIRAADEWQADLIVVYHNRHREVNEVFSHSCSQRVADHATCSVLRLRNVQSRPQGS